MRTKSNIRKRNKRQSDMHPVVRDNNRYSKAKTCPLICRVFINLNLTYLN